MIRLLRYVLVFILSVHFGASAWAASLSPLSIRTHDGAVVKFTVEMAVTPDEAARGLMNRPSLPADNGMLFDFGGEKPIAMWMKNTLIPLDMLFIDNQGKIVGIAQRTVPLSLETIASPGPVRAVLEINGGISEHHHIQVGDQVSHAIFKN